MILENKIAIVTGGTRGIGKAIVKEFALHGARVLFTFANNDNLADETSAEVSKMGGYAKGYKLNVRDYESITKWKEEIIDKYKSIDILVNNAGIIKDNSLLSMSREEWLDVIDTNLNGLYNVTKPFIYTFMKQRSGTIINIASISGVVGMARQINYSSSKGGMIAFTKSLAKEVAPFNIRVNAIAPGFIDTDMVKGLKAEYVKSMMPRIPLERFGTVDEVAKSALFLASSQSDYITGQVLMVDGGMGM